MTAPDRIAVYGTLVPGGANEHVLDAIPGRWTRGTVAGTRHEDGWHGYPGVVVDRGAAPDGESGRVRVHVLYSPELADHLDRLDAFEGPGYRRVVTPVRLDDGRRVEAWIYTLVEPPC